MFSGFRRILLRHTTPARRVTGLSETSPFVGADRAAASFRRLLPHLCLVGVLLICFAAYYPGLSGGYVFDDYANIVRNQELAVGEFSLGAVYQVVRAGAASPLARPVSMLTLALNRNTTGLDPWFFKLTNLLIHLANGVAVYLLTRLLLSVLRRTGDAVLTDQQMDWFAVVIAGVWVLHPLALTSVLYVVQRMTSLSALFTFLGLITYVGGRQRLGTGWGKSLMLLGLLVFGSLGVLCKENAALLPLLMFVVEATLFRFRCSDRMSRRFLYLFFGVSIGLPALAAVAWVVTHPEWLPGAYAGRPFTITERLMTEGRVLWVYLRLILLPDITAMGLYHDDIHLSTGMLAPWTTLAAATGLAALLAVAAWGVRRAPPLAFAILFFLAGHILESTVLPLEIAHEHRNYLPMYGVLFGGMFYAMRLVGGIRAPLVRGVAIALVMALLAVNTAVRASYWGDSAELSLMEVQNHPESGRARYEAGRFYTELMTKAAPEDREHHYYKARQYFESAAAIVEYPNDALFALLHLSYLAHREPDPQWLDALMQELQSEPFGPSQANALFRFIECQILGACKLPEEKAFALIQAALDNPTLSRVRAAAVLATAGMYALATQKVDAALRYIHVATTLRPRAFAYRLSVVDLFTKLKLFPLASDELGQIAALDSAYRYTPAFQKRQRALQAAMGAERTAGSL